MRQYFSFQAKIARLEFALTTIGLGILSTCISACCDTTYYDPFSGTFQDAPLDPLAAIVAVVILTFLLFLGSVDVLQATQRCESLQMVGVVNARTACQLHLVALPVL